MQKVNVEAVKMIYHPIKAFSLPTAGGIDCQQTVFPVLRDHPRPVDPCVCEKESVRVFVRVCVSERERKRACSCVCVCAPMSRHSQAPGVKKLTICISHVQTTTLNFFHARDFA